MPIVNRVDKVTHSNTKNSIVRVQWYLHRNHHYVTTMSYRAFQTGKACAKAKTKSMRDKTKADAMVNAHLKLSQMKQTLETVLVDIREVQNLILSDKLSKNQRRRMDSSLGEIANVITDIISNVDSVVNDASIVPHLGYAVERIEVEKKRKKQQNEAHGVISEATSTGAWGKYDYMITEDASWRNSVNKSCNHGIVPNGSTGVIPYPKPQYGKMYHKNELMTMLYEISSVERGKVIDDLLRRNLVPCGKRNIYLSLKQKIADPTKIFQDWGDTSTRG